MAVNVVKLGFVGLDVVRVEAMTHHFADIVGLPAVTGAGADGAAYFACGSERHVLGLYPAEERAIRHMGYRIDSATSLTEARRHLSDLGIEVAEHTDMFPGISSALEIHDTDGYTIYLYNEASGPVEPYADRGVSPIKLGHTALMVRDWSISAKFYQEVLGFRISDWCDGVFVFMRCNSEHHTLNLTNFPRHGMFHLAFEVRDLGHIGRACDFLATKGITTVWGPGRHGIGHSLFAYHRDPDGNIIEFMSDMDRMSNEGIGYFDPRPYHEDMPQRPKAWDFSPASSNTWGTMPPDTFMT